jgi:hypothetical protein
MFSKLVAGIKVARAGFKTYAAFQARLEAILKADGDLDGTPTLQELKAVFEDMKSVILILFEHSKRAAALIKELIVAAAKADHVVALIPAEDVKEA